MKRCSVGVKIPNAAMAARVRPQRLAFVNVRWSSTENSNGSAATDSASASASSGGEAADPAKPKSEETITKLEAEIRDMKEKVMRHLAEEENVRRIARRDVDNARSYAINSFAKSLLEVADDLERALLAVPADKKEGADVDPTLKTLLTGIEMTEKTLHKVFQSHGVVKYGAVGKYVPFT
jgi:molecular chaperone GrpE